MLQGFSVLGCGLMQLGFRRDAEGLEMTRWLTVLYVPLIPLSRWRVQLIHTLPPVIIHLDETQAFRPVERLPLDLLAVLRTAVGGWLLFAIALAPPLAWVFVFPGPKNDLELVLMLATCAWPTVVLLWYLGRTTKIFRGNT